MVQYYHMKNIKKSHHHPSRAMSQDEMEHRRKEASRYFNTKSNPWIAKKYSVSRISVYEWKKKWETDGVQGLKSGVYGRVSKMTKKEEADLKKNILKGAKKCGYDTDFWTLKRLTSYIKKEMGIVYQDRSLAHTLKRFGMTCQKPMRRARERNEKAISTWVTQTWPAIKKGA